MTSVRRWLAVLAGTALLIALPSIVGALPAGSSSLTATQLLARIDGSVNQPYSGYAESTGGLSLPVTDQFSSIGNLFGGQTELRVWQRSATDIRVDSIGFSGETDYHSTADGLWTWVYENNTATYTPTTTKPTIRLPTASDLLPPQLARRVLSEATAGEAGRIPAARIAGRSAPGLRITPSEAASTIAHVDVWADPSTGLPVRVEIVGKNSKTPALSSSFLDLSTATPAASTVAFTPPSGATVHSSPEADLATSIDQFGQSTPVASLAGIPRNALLPKTGAVGVYGRGITEFIAVPLPRRTAYSLRQQLSKTTPDASPTDALALTSGPVNLLLTSTDDSRGAWLLIGDVTPATLTQAVAELPTNGGFGR